jgi:CheY-like chemotaxis protein
VAKILVADDNSNVQKTVALALADLGVEVIAVNNGDAAVKKLADVMPDLVLADIFMPVRNGYEVCEYVKRDSRFSHMPVVLLVGAFDPLDEREAQRVGADGILKKPFVPPDPLIAMVKTLLDRTLSERMVTAAVAKPVAVVAKQSRSGGVAVADENHSTSEISEESNQANFRPPVDRVSFGEGNHPVAFSQLLDSPAIEASPADMGEFENVDDEQILTSSRDASLGDPIFWKTEDAEPEGDPETDPQSDEAQEKVTADVPTRGWNLGDEASGDAKEDDSAKVEEPLELVRDDMDEEAGSASTVVESVPMFAQDAASQASLNVESGKPDDLAANPIEWMASVPPPPEEEAPAALPEWGAALAEAADMMGTKEKETNAFLSESKPVSKEAPATSAIPVSVTPAAVPTAPSRDSAASEKLAVPVSAAPAAISSTPMQDAPALTPSKLAIATVAAELLKTQPALKPSSQSVEDTVRSMPKHDWADLAASIQPKAMEPVAEKPKPVAAPADQSTAAPMVNAQLAASNPLPTALKPLAKTLENTGRPTPRLEWAELAASLQPTKFSEPAADKSKPDAPVVQASAAPPVPVINAPAISTPSLVVTTPASGANGQSTPADAAVPNLSTGTLAPGAPPDPALVEAVVQRVLEKMRPQVVDIITKEFLRPVVQALVHREITKR